MTVINIRKVFLTKGENQIASVHVATCTKTALKQTRLVILDKQSKQR